MSTAKYVWAHDVHTPIKYRVLEERGDRLLLRELPQGEDDTPFWVSRNSVYPTRLAALKRALVYALQWRDDTTKIKRAIEREKRKVKK